jgi:hypothetical protein
MFFYLDGEHAYREVHLARREAWGRGDVGTWGRGGIRSDVALDLDLASI